MRTYLDNLEEKESRACDVCCGTGEITVCCEAHTLIRNKVRICSECKEESPKMFVCPPCEGTGFESPDAEQDRREDAEESFRDAFRDE